MQGNAIIMVEIGILVSSMVLLPPDCYGLDVAITSYNTRGVLWWGYENDDKYDPYWTVVSKIWYTDFHYGSQNNAYG